VLPERSPSIIAGERYMERMSESMGLKGKMGKGSKERACSSPRVLRGRLHGQACISANDHFKTL